MDCEIADNRCSESGGGLFGCNGLISRCTIARNQALGWHGGGLSQCGWVIACSITDNVAVGLGGGVHECLSIRSSLVAKNRATLDGGGLYGCREVSNCTVANNQSGRNGGGLFCEGGVVLVRNSVFWSNAAVNANEMYFSCSTGGSDPAQPDIVIEYSDVQKGTADITVSPGCILSWHPANIDADPCFVAAGADFHLLPNSPCIDAGDPNYLMEPDETDLFGKPRLVGRRIDIGAHEYPEEPTWYVNAQWGNDKNAGCSLLTALATIREAINRAVNGNTVLVYPGVYRQPVDFLGKALTVRSAQDAAVLDVPTYYHAVRFGSNEGPDSVLQNLIIRNSSLAILVLGASPTLRNLTIVNNRRGIEAKNGAQPDISNCIFWNNAEGDLIGCSARYSRLTNSTPGEGNSTLDPMFADATQNDFHVKSERGRYWAKFDVWVLDKVTSPCIDGGDPNMDTSREPMPNGSRVNMGAYGDTSYASMKELRANPSDINRDGWVNMVDMAMLGEAWLIFDPPSSNQHPSASIVCPSNNAVFDCKIKQFEIIATTADSDGIVLKVEFFADGEKIGEDSDGTDGWKVVLTGFKGSRYTLTAVAYDDDGAAGLSDRVTITVCGPRG
jgi:predicted outer membrane repeat protein